jgi:hypothetical protein
MKNDNTNSTELLKHNVQSRRKKNRAYRENK